MLKNRLLLGGLLIILAGLLAIIFAPFIVSNGLYVWIRWKAGQQKLTVKIEKIDAPLLRPVVLQGFHLASAPDAACRFEVIAPRATVDLNLKATLMRLRGRAIQSLSVEGLRIETHRNRPEGTFSQSGWNTLQSLLPNNFNVERFNLRIEDGPTVILMRNVSLSASQTEAGRLQAGEIMITSPAFRQTFSDLRGATNWQGDRLTVAGLSLTRGLDVQSITGDLSHLGKQRVGLEFDLDAFGGKIRAHISNEWRADHSNWSLVGSATDISLEQTSEAVGFTDRVGGSLRACKFTFRGDIRYPMRATASLWTELTDPTWRGRTAETIMLGVAFFNQQIQLQQLYIKQHQNELTLSGEGSLPSKTSDWLNPDFRGDISASINDLGAFARLFGANPKDFAGKIAIEGMMNARDRRIGGRLTMDGTSLTIFKTPIDLFSARLNLKAAELEIEQLELKRKDDSLRMQGKIDMSREHNYSGGLNATIKDVAPHLAFLRGTGAINSKGTSAEIQASISSSVWEAHGSVTIPDSSPLNFTAKFPLPIGADWNSILNAPFNGSLDFPVISLTHAPQFWRNEIFRDGILSGNLSISETLRHPKISGQAQLKDGKLGNTPFVVTKASGHLTFKDTTASIDLANVGTDNVDLSFHGEMDFKNPESATIKIIGNQRILDLSPPAPGACIKGVKLSAVPASPSTFSGIEEIHFRGNLFGSDWTLALVKNESGQLAATAGYANAMQTFRFCPDAQSDGEMLVLGSESRAKPEKVRPQKRAKSR